MYNLRDDQKLVIICRNIVRTIPAMSIFLCGSRATGQGVCDSSDYDIGVVMKTLSIPFYLGKLKELERRLSQEFNIDLAINPLPTFKLHKAKGNLFLFKLKKEGITLYGQDCLQSLEPGDIKDIQIHWHFSYLFTAMKELTHSFSPELVTTRLDKWQRKALGWDAAKALLHCGEVHLLVNNYYETATGDVISKLHEFDLQDMDKQRFLKDLDTALYIRERESAEIKDLLDFWFATREHLLATFRLLIRTYLGYEASETKELAIKYSRVRNGSKLKDLQYFVIASLDKKKIFWRSLITGISVEKRMWLALLWLLLSIDRTGYIDKECLLHSYNMLKFFVTMDHSEDEIVFWKHVSGSIMEYYPLACPIMGI